MLSKVWDDIIYPFIYYLSIAKLSLAMDKYFFPHFIN